MEDILWIIFLIIISNVFSKKKKAGMQQKTQPRQQSRKVKPSARSIEDYFKDIAQKVQEQYHLETQPAPISVEPEVLQPAKPKASSQQQPEKTSANSIATVAPAEYDASHPIYGKAQLSSGISLFEDRDDIVRGIIYSEILQKPISMRKKN